MPFPPIERREGRLSRAAAPRILIDGWLVEPAAARMSKGASVVRLRPQVMDLLIYLADCPGRVRGQREALSSVWGGSACPSSLTRGIAELRRAFGDDARQARVIETIAKRGYRLIAPVTPHVVDERQEPQGRPAPPPARPPEASFCIAEWRVEPSPCRLVNGETVVRLRPQLMDLLVCLAAGAGRTVARGDLFAAVWKGQFVAESGLARCVAELRRALGDSAHGSRFIETIPKRGYRLAAPLRPGTGTVKAVSSPSAKEAQPAAPADEGAGRPSASPGRPVSRRAWVAFAPLAVALAVVLYLVGLGPVPQKPRVVLSLLTTIADAETQDWLKAALTAGLASSRFEFQSDGREGDAAAVIVASVTRVGQRYVLSLEALGRRSGASLGRSMAEAADADALVDAASRGASMLRTRIEGALASLAEADKPRA